MLIHVASVTQWLSQVWAFLTTGRVMATIAGGGFALLAIALLIASRTRWGQSKLVTKCVVLSILAHIWLLMYAMGVRTMLPQGDPRGSYQSVAITFEEAPPEQQATEQPQPTEPADQLAEATWQQPVALEQLPKPPELGPRELLQWEKPPELLAEVTPTPLPPLPENLMKQLNQEEPLVAQPEPPAAPQSASESVERMTKSVLPPAMPDTPIPNPQKPNPATPDPQMPSEYQLRQAQNRLELARPYGADADSEAAVEAALDWLAKAQSDDGSWNAARFGGGTETNALGENRHNTGNRADTGVSGLALLAFLSAGHTHLDGKHRETVAKGLSYLLQAQMPSGDLSGPKQIGNEQSVVNARMYCHSIAFLALAEAHAMTHDQIIREGLIKAAQFTLAAQDVRGGGWRYRPGDPGDLSLFGWKAMALKSVSRSGIEVPLVVTRRMHNFLDSCAVGKGGLARYRPSEGRPSETMTAEALACRMLLDYPLSREARREATEMIMRNLPGTQPDNVYYWYYATLALFQFQDENWRVWNQAMKNRLLQTQEPGYSNDAGSWKPDGIWGGYGGRVYSTAMSCLCLEVYYRYLPLYQRSAVSNPSLQNVSR
ncbi:MAG: hypothetical protein U0930_20270 [Pirellulales bacterium]